MRALVTGGGGFLGSAIVRILHERGDEVSVLGRGTYPHVAAYIKRAFQADIRLTSAVHRACEEMDLVFHVASLAGIWGKRSDFWSINVEGTRNVIDACLANRVPRLVYTSSPSVVFGRDDLCGVDESTPYPPRYLAAYPETKAAAEQTILAANSARLATVALRPHLIFGPGDPHLIPRVIARARAGRLRQVGDGRNLVDITYIDNAASAHVQAADALGPGSPCAGKAYFISQGKPVALWPWLNDLLERVGVPTVTRSVSFEAAYRIGAAYELAYHTLGLSREPPMTRFLAAQLAKSTYFDVAAARRDFAYTLHMSTDEGVQQLVASLRGQGGHRPGSGIADHHESDGTRR
jgi:nucleoside-diphosphate-sugar epimerase